MSLCRSSQKWKTRKSSEGYREVRGDGEGIVPP